MVTRIKKSCQRWLFNRLVSDILDTAPLAPKEGEPTIVSMLCHADILMYLLAIKSFYRQIGRGRIIIINDGTLNKNDIELLKYHVDPDEIIAADSLVSDACPTYISWKKLFCIAKCISDAFTIQLDSDTLTIGDIGEVGRFVETATSFILGT